MAVRSQVLMDLDKNLDPEGSFAARRPNSCCRTLPLATRARCVESQMMRWPAQIGAMMAGEMKESLRF